MFREVLVTIDKERTIWDSEHEAEVCKSSTNRYMATGGDLRAHNSLAEFPPVLQDRLCHRFSARSTIPQPADLPGRNLQHHGSHERKFAEAWGVAELPHVQNQHEKHPNPEIAGNPACQRQVFAQEHGSIAAHVGRARRETKEEEDRTRRQS